MKRVLHILNSSSYSGAENVVINIINNIKENCICAYVSREGSIRNILEKNKINFYPIKKMTISEIRNVVKQFKPDIIHAHDYTASIICAFSGIKIPIISHLHNNSSWIRTFHPYSFAFLLSCICYKKILMVSSSILNEYIFGSIIKKNCMIISNPIDIKTIRQKAMIQNDEIIINYDIVYLGRFSAEKNPLRFIYIVSELRKKLPSIKAAMIGSGTLYDICKDKINILNINNNLILTGFMENPYKVLSKAKILCMTSEWEGYGLVAVEALSLGIPVIAPPVGGLPEILNDSCGKLCANDNEIINEIEKLLCDYSYWKIKNIKAKEQANKLNNIDDYIKKVKMLYEL
jgi:glycosyltransferase involved in cell wall biosynthesis